MLASKLSTQNKDKTYPRIKKNLSDIRWFQALYVCWAGLGDGRSFANGISGSREAIDMGQGLLGRETVGLKHITR